MNGGENGKNTSPSTTTITGAAFKASSSSSNNNSNNGVNSSAARLVDFLCLRFLGPNMPAKGLAYVDPLGLDEYVKGYELTRTKKITLQASFTGSAERFAFLALNGKPIRMTVEQLLNGRIEYLYPDEQRADDRRQGVTPHDFDPEAVLMNSISILEPENELPFPVGTYTNAIPTAYEELKKQQVEELSERLGIKLPENYIYAQIPSNCTAGGAGGGGDEARFAQMVKDRPIHVLNEVINGYHGEEVTRCIGGMCVQHFWKGIITLTPQECIQWRIDPPPPRHDAKNPDNVDAEDQQVNVWLVVPHNHVLGHITQLTNDAMKQYGYVAHQMYLPNGITAIPFILMDLWTARNYADAFIRSALIKVDRDRIPIKDVCIELRPLKNNDWISGCKAGQHHLEGTVRFKLELKYTMFTRTFRKNERIVAAISEKFPRLNMHRKQEIDAATAQDISMNEKLAKAAEVSAAKYTKKILGNGKKDEEEEEDGGGVQRMDEGDDGDDDNDDRNGHVMSEDQDDDDDDDDDAAAYMHMQQTWHAAF